MQALEGQAPEVLQENRSALTDMVLSALNSFNKPARRNEALKAVYSVALALNAKGSSLKTVLGAKMGKTVSSAVQKANEGSEKSGGYVGRLLAVLDGAQGAAGKQTGVKKRELEHEPPVRKATKK